MIREPITTAPLPSSNPGPEECSRMNLPGVYRAPARKNAPTAMTTPITPPKLLLALSMPALGIVGDVVAGGVPVGYVVWLDAIVVAGAEVMVGRQLVVELEKEVVG